MARRNTNMSMARMRGNNDRHKTESLLMRIEFKKIEYLNPEDIFSRLRNSGNVFLLESGGSKGSWSFVGIGKRKKGIVDFKRTAYAPQKIPKSAPPFIGGWVGFLSYDYGVRRMGVKQKVKDDF